MSIADANFSVADNRFFHLVRSRNVREVSEIVDVKRSECLTCYNYGMVVVRNIWCVHIYRTLNITTVNLPYLIRLDSF